MKNAAARMAVSLLLLGTLLPHALSQEPARAVAAPEPCQATFSTCEPCCPVTCCDCCSAPGYYARAEYLRWKPRAYHSDTVMQTVDRSKICDAPDGFLGVNEFGLPVFDDPNPHPILPVDVVGGAVPYQDQSFSGVRITVGQWVNCDHSVAIEASGFWLPESHSDLPGPLSLARSSFGNHLRYPGTGFDPVGDYRNCPGQPQLPGVRGAWIINPAVRAETETGSIEFNARWQLCKPCSCPTPWRAELLTGLRYFRLHDDLSIAADFVGRRFLGQERFADGRRETIFDDFETANDFFAGQVGVQVEYRCERWSIELRGKIAMGEMHQRITINGQTTLETTSGGIETATGGMFAQGTNIGEYDRHVFAWMPEVGVNVGFDLTPCIRVLAGYTLIYFADDIVRPGAQIDTRVNMTQAPIYGTGLVGEARPGVPFKDESFWLRGMSLGVEWSF